PARATWHLRCVQRPHLRGGLEQPQYRHRRQRDRRSHQAVSPATAQQGPSGKGRAFFVASRLSPRPDPRRRSSMPHPCNKPRSRSRCTALAFSPALVQNPRCISIQSAFRIIAMATKLTDRQQEILDLIRVTVERTGFPPTRAEIARALGFRSPNAAEDHLKALARKGAIELTAGASRGIRLKDAGHSSASAAAASAAASSALAGMADTVGRL